MVFICGRVVDEDREPLNVVSDGIISQDLQIIPSETTFKYFSTST